jgi:D-mannonate dehydratase
MTKGGLKDGLWVEIDRLEGVLRPDHVPTIAGDDNQHPGYSSIGRLFAIGCAKGL